MKTTETKVEEEREKKKRGARRWWWWWVDGCRAMVVQQQSRAWKLAMWTPPLVHSTQTHHWRNEANSSTTTTTWIFDVSWVELLLMFFFLFFQPNNHRSPHHFFLLLLFLNFVVMITSLIIIQNLLYMPGRTVKTTFVKTLILFYSIYFLIIEFLWCCFSFLFQRLSLSLDDKSVNDPRKIKKKEEEKERTDKLVIHLPPFSLSLSLSPTYSNNTLRIQQ